MEMIAVHRIYIHTNFMRSSCLNRLILTLKLIENKTSRGQAMSKPQIATNVNDEKEITCARDRSRLVPCNQPDEDLHRDENVRKEEEDYDSADRMM